MVDLKPDPTTAALKAPEPPAAAMLRESLRAIAPVLSKALHKGQCGRVAVFGGSTEYTGAPYFAGIAALKSGADLSYVVCPKDASSVIKSYSAELIVYPTLNNQLELHDTLTALAGRLHTVVIGPGFGRADNGAESFKTSLDHFKSINLPIVIDADGLHFVSEDIALVRNCKSIILTPNEVEFEKLFKKVVSQDITDKNNPERVKTLSQKLGGVTILRKGEKDVISNGDKLLCCETDSSGRRCGGQGDLLCGSLATFLHWADVASSNLKIKKNDVLEEYGAVMLAAYGACILTKECNKLAFEKFGRSTTTGNMIDEIHRVVKNLFD